MHTTEQLNTALAGRYLIERLVGEGGMATVYLARDLKHDRQVALKVLKPELGAVLGVERFLAEIKVTANLQHPNLLPLFDSGEAGGLLFYVMPYVEGESLRARLEREKQLPIDEAVRFSLAVASALDYAHRHGVIHRDLKPENILLHDGQPVIADFGIALAVSKAGGARVTQTGLSLGTPQYMSPEQASGDRAIDARSDIYSLAAVTYEMIAGEAPHSGPTAQAIIAKLMTAEPQPLSKLRSSAPVHVEIAVAKALAKLPADRYSTAREFADAIEGKGFSLAAHTTAARAGAAPAVSIARHPLVLALGAVAVAAVAVAGYEWSLAHRASERTTVRFSIPLVSTMLAGGVAAGSDVAVSADGNMIAFVAPSGTGSSRIYVRTLDDVAPRALTGTDDGQEPFFSPDGQWVGFYANSVLAKVAIGGGAPIPIATVGGGPAGVSWSPSGAIITSIANNLVTVPATGGQPRLLAVPDTVAGDRYLTNPVALPDGETALIGLQPIGGIPRTKLAAVSMKTGKLTRFDVVGLQPLGVADGLLIYATVAGAVFGVPFDAAKLRITGDPVALGINVLLRAGGVADAALSPAGTFVAQSGSVSGQVGLVDMSGQFRPLMPDPRPYAYPRYSPDGKHIALTIGAASRNDVWAYDIASATSTRLTTEGTANERPEWTPDGTRVLYRSDRGARSAIWWQPSDLSGNAAPLLASAADDFFEGVLSPDGKAIVYQVDNAGNEAANVMYRLLSGDTTPKPIAATTFIEAQARLSPDGKWVAFVTDASGAGQVVVQPFPGPGSRVQVSAAGGAEPVWARDGRRLFYRDGQRFVAATYTTSPTFAVSGRTPLFVDGYVFAQSPHANYDVSPDGTHLLVIRNAEAATLVVVHNWSGELRARMAGRK
ncbi:MAG: protein kinase [Gemmatimonadales bacterium]